MIIVFVTHATAAKTSPRPLDKTGCSEAQAAAQQVKKLLHQKAKVTQIISSPAVRCIHTVLIVAEDMGKTDMIQTTEINTQKELGEIDKAAIPTERLEKVVRGAVGNETEVLLIGTHGDLGNALPQSSLISGRDSGGWFEKRPVIVIVDYDKSRVWDENKVVHCQAYSMSGWENLLLGDSNK